MGIVNERKIDSSSQTQIQGLPGPNGLGFKLTDNNYVMQQKKSINFKRRLK